MRHSEFDYTYTTGELCKQDSEVEGLTLYKTYKYMKCSRRWDATV